MKTRVGKLGIVILLTTILLALTLSLFQWESSAARAAHAPELSEKRAVGSEEKPNDELQESVVLLVQELQPATAAPGDAVVITVRLSNPGPQPLTGVVVRDVLPPGLSYVSASDEGAYDAQENEVAWELGFLGAGEEVAFTVQAEVEEGFGARLPNLVEASAAALDVNAVSIKEIRVPTARRAASVSPAAAAQIITVTKVEKIQDAIDLANPGDTIRVEKGTFTESLTIDKSLTLMGGYDATFTDRNRIPRTTVISPSSRGISITGSMVDVTVDGFEIKNGDAGAGDGGGILVDVDTDSRVALNDNSIHDNVAANGGGVWADVDVRSKLELTNNDVVSNAASGDGGGIYADVYMSGTLTLDDNDVVSNTAGSGYGGFYAYIEYFGRFSVDDNEVISNTALSSDYGGFYFGAYYNTHGVFDRNDVVSNTAPSGSYGGGHVELQYNVTSTFDDNVFRGNTASSNTGGLRLDVEYNTRAVGNRLTLANNTAGDSRGGGHVYLRYGSALTMTEGITVTGNVASSGDNGGLYFYIDYQNRLYVPDMYVYDNRAASGTGGVKIYSSSDGHDTVIAPNARVISNTSGTGSGGGAYAYVQHKDYFDFSGSRYERNNAGGSGGGLYVSTLEEGATLLLNDTQFLTNTSGSNGGGANVSTPEDGAFLELYSARFISNTASSGGGGLYMGYASHGGLQQEGRFAFVISDTLFERNVAGGSGGAYRLGYCEYGCRYKIDHNRFVQNHADSSGGAWYVSGDMGDEGGWGSFSYNEVLSNTSDSAGGGVYLSGGLGYEGGMAFFNHNTFIGNVAQGDGGAARLYEVEDGSYAEVMYNTFINNAAQGGGADGGALYFGYVDEGSTLELRYNTILSNTAGGNGGGIRLNEVDDGSTLWMTDNQIDHNEAANDGGGIHFDNYFQTAFVYVERNSIQYNLAGRNGGGFYDDSYFADDGAVVHFKDNLVNHNTAWGDYGAGRIDEIEGGAQVVISGNEFNYNTAAGDHGGVYVEQNDEGSSTHFLGNEIVGNRAGFSGTQVTGGSYGGVYFDEIKSGAEVRFRDNLVMDNTAYLSGTNTGLVGGMYAQLVGGGLLVMEDNTIADNTAQDSFGGLEVVMAESWLEMEHNLISANTAVTVSGGVHISGTVHAQYWLRRNQIVNNVAGAQGGLWIWDGDDTLWGVSENNIIAGNQGSGVYLQDADFNSTHDTIANNAEYGIMMTGAVTSTARLYNTIVWSHTWPFTRTQVPAYTDRFTMTADYSDIEGGWPGTGNLDVYPLFVGDGDYHLRYESPCVGAADPGALAIDVDGDARPFEGGYDIGADEWTPVPTIPIGGVTLASDPLGAIVPWMILAALVVLAGAAVMVRKRIA